MKVNGVDQREIFPDLERADASRGRREVREARAGLPSQERDRNPPLQEPPKAKRPKEGELERLKEEIQRLQELLREKIREFLESNDWSIRYRLDRDTETVITQLVEGETGEVVRQIPSEVALRIKATLAQIMKGDEGEAD